MDLYYPFKHIIEEKFYHATTLADTFHFTKLVMQALDELRLSIWRNTKGAEKKYFKSIKLSLEKDISKVNAKDT